VTTPTLGGVRAALPPHLSLAAGAARRRAGTWLDTADWLLHRKALACELLGMVASEVKTRRDPKND
jgi:hypothetical protein